MTPLQAKSVCHQLRFTHVVGRGWKQDANAFFDNLHRMSDKWVLAHGIHRGTLTSRDSGNPEEFDTEQEAMTAFRKHKDWFAYLTSPNGDKRLLESNPYW